MSTIPSRVRVTCRRAPIARFALVVACAAGMVGRAHAQVRTIPARLADSTFWRLVSEFSEEGGFFRSDNFVSNETTFQYVIPHLLEMEKPGGVYLGVGPEQNFTYIVALKPKIAFIFDIRRQNMLTHLMYKALIEESADRAEFLSRLFARQRPAALDTATKVNALFAGLSAALPDSAAFRKNLAAIKERLVKRHGFTLSDEDLRTIEYVYTAFFFAGPEVNYSYGQNSYRMGSMPSYSEVMVATDEAGLQRSYLASEANFRALKQLELDNLVVPLVGDFAGPKAIRAVGSYLRERGATVTAFYTSNVEQYLFGDSDTWRRFFTNVGTLPVDSASTFIRAFFNGMGGMRYPGGGPRSVTMLGSIAEQVRLFHDGRLASYFDLMNYSKP